MESSEAAQICGQATRLLIPRMERIRSTENLDSSQVTEAVASASSRMDPSEAASMLAAAVERSENADVRHALVLGLVIVAKRLDTAEDERICGQVARVLIAALGRETNVSIRLLLAEDVVAVVDRLVKTEAARFCGQAAQVLTVAFASEADANARDRLAIALTRVSARLVPADVTRTRGPAARVLAESLEREIDEDARYPSAVGLVWLAGLTDQSEFISPVVIALLLRETNNNLCNRLASLAGRSDPEEAARIYGQAALGLAAALEHEKDFHRRPRLASSLASLAGRLDSPEAAQIRGQAARSLAEALAREPDDGVRMSLGSGLSSMVARMAPAESASVLAEAVVHCSNPACLIDLARILSTTADRLDDNDASRIFERLVESLDRGSLYSIAPELLQQLNPGSAHSLAWDLASGMCSEPELYTDAFSRILTDASREHRARRATHMVLTGPGLEGAAEAAILVLADPYPCRLTTQELVELLKMPTCFGGARRIVLDHLGNRYHRRFVNHWAFVRFAREQMLGLDFTTPPKRPDRKESPERMRPRQAKRSAVSQVIGVEQIPGHHGKPIWRRTRALAISSASARVASTCSHSPGSNWPGPNSCSSRYHSSRSSDGADSASSTITWRPSVHSVGRGSRGRICPFSMMARIVDMGLTDHQGFNVTGWTLSIVLSTRFYLGSLVPSIPAAGAMRRARPDRRSLATPTRVVGPIRHRVGWGRDCFPSHRRPGSPPMAVSTTPTTHPAGPVEPFGNGAIPPLENGDRLTRDEFERRYDATPNLKNAELIDGVVYLRFRTRHRQHAAPHARLAWWLGYYAAFTPGLEAGNSSHVRLDGENMPQPDVLLFIQPERGGQARIDEEDYVAGAPEFVAEVVSSSVSYDLYEKLHVYLRHGVREYVVWRVLDGEIDWFVNREGVYLPLTPGRTASFAARSFPASGSTRPP